MPSNWECLVKNTEKIDNITITLGCLGEEVGEVMLEDKSNKNTGASFINPRIGTQSAKQFRLDDYNFPTPVDALFLDVEGYELKILLGGHILIHNDRPALIVVEENGLQKRRFRMPEKALGKYLETFGYQAVERWEEDVIYILEDNHYD
jgi:FkbM family methyltransferase